MCPLLGSYVALVNVDTLLTKPRDGPGHFWSRVAAPPRTSSAYEPLHSQVAKASSSCPNQCPASYPDWARCGSCLSACDPTRQNCCYRRTSECVPHCLSS